MADSPRSQALVRGWTKHLTPPVAGWQRTDPLDQGLVADWRIDQNTGLTLPDYSGRGYHGTVVGADWVNTEYGPALDCIDANWDYINTNNQRFGGTGLFCANTERFTLEIFCKVPVNPAGYLLGKHTVAAGHTFSFYITAAAARSPRIILRGVNTDTAAGIDDDLWHVQTVTWDATTARYYIDGTFFMNLNVGAAAEAASNLYFGVQAVAGGNPIDATFASVRIWDRDLTAAEIQRRYVICRQRAGAMTSPWMLPWGRSPVAPTTQLILTTYAGYSQPVG